MSHLDDGWHDLPSGGSVEIKNGIPVQVTDKGYENLEDTRMLAEAAEYTNMNLIWRSNTRSTRWREDSFLKGIFNAVENAPHYAERRFWSYAHVWRQTCGHCGVALGVRWIDVPPAPRRQWVCDACVPIIAEEIEELSKDPWDKDPYKG